MRDFYDDAQLAAVYTPELKVLVARLTGATEVVVYDHTRRSSDGDTRVKQNWRPPVPLPHSDYTDASAAQRLRDVFPDDADERLRRRYAIVNVWRSIAGPVEQWPLALCDARSVDDALMHIRRSRTRPPRPIRRRAKASRAGSSCSTTDAVCRSLAVDAGPPAGGQRGISVLGSMACTPLTLLTVWVTCRSQANEQSW